MLSLRRGAQILRLIPDGLARRHMMRDAAPAAPTHAPAACRVFSAARRVRARTAHARQHGRGEMFESARGGRAMLAKKGIACRAARAQGGTGWGAALTVRAFGATPVTRRPRAPAGERGPCARHIAASAAVTPSAGDRRRALDEAAKQSFDYTLLEAVCTEIRSGWIPSKVQSVQQVDAVTVSVRLRALEGTANLIVSWGANSARVTLQARDGSAATTEPFAFAQTLAAKLKDLVLTGADVAVPWERVARLEFARRPDEPPCLSLVVEPMGRHSNVFLLAEDGETIVAAAKQIGEGQSRERQVRVGERYVLPPPAAGREPSDALDAADLRDAVLAVKDDVRGGAVAKCLARALLGVSPALGAELCCSAGVDPTQDAGTISDATWLRLRTEVARWVAAVRTGAFRAGLCVPARCISAISDGRTGVYEDAPGGPGATVSDALGALRPGESGQEQHAAVRAVVDRALKFNLKRARGRVAALEEQERAGYDAPKVRHQGELLVANVWRIKPGMKEIEVDDWETGEKVTVKLEADKKPHEQAEAIFKKAKKLQRALETLGPLMEEAKNTISYLESIQSAADQLWEYRGPEDLAALREVLAELRDGGYVKDEEQRVRSQLNLKESKASRKARQKQQGAKSAGGGGGFRQFESPGGLKVLVGRNNRQNDELSMRVARANDVWMHARGCPGAHLVMRVEPGDDVQDADIAFAAALAVHYSRARQEARFDVSMCRGRDVGKPKGAKPGMVVIKGGEQVVIGRPADAADAIAATSDTD
ncbi:unnamed protein product [Pedinophyceae sp. YPF-701]|nr:unnamed protein product [Pedinophyceae sp. YPF-701]